MRTEDLLGLIRFSLWGTGTARADREIYEEMKRHGIALLPAARLSSLVCEPELKREWKLYALHQLSRSAHYSHEQSALPLTVPYTILKGASAAMYYPYPEYRAVGDIDIMTRREDYAAARRELLDAGYQVKLELNRHVQMTKNGIMVELHRRFAVMNDPVQAQYLDDLIIDSVTPAHILPDPVNGLVLLAHINEHLEGGMGLRQLIDWMMFVDKCLPDEKWPAFRALAEKTGLVRLAAACTRLCELYLGLSPHGFCAEADAALCGQLLEYVLSCGNFGRKMTGDSTFVKKLVEYTPRPLMLFHLLQKQGLFNWKAAQKHKLLRPFAWAYQASRYVIRGVRVNDPVSKMKTEYAAAQKRNALFDALGVKRMGKGYIVYEDGKYIKRYGKEK